MQITLAGSPNAGYVTSMSIAAGETVSESLTIASGGGPVDLTGYTLKMQVNFPEPLLLTTGNGGISVTNAAGGAAQINLSEAASAALAPGTFPFDLWMVSGGGQATRLLNGLFTVDQSLAPIP